MITQIKRAKERTGFQLVRILVAILVIIASTASTVAASSVITKAYVFCDDELIRVVSFSSDPQEIINKANVEIGENDLVDMTGFVKGEDDGIIYVYRACEVTIIDGNEKYFVKIAGTVANALEAAGIELNTGDKLNCDKNTYVFDSMTIEITRAYGVTIVADGKAESYDVLADGTVAQALETAGVTFGKNDELNVKPDQKVKEGMKIIVKRVSYSTRKEVETLSYTTKQVSDSSLYKDQSKVLKPGKNGTKSVTYKDKYIDGELVESTVVKTKVIEKATERVIAVGTKERPVIKVDGVNTMSRLTPPESLTLDENGRPTSYKRLITGKATAYCSGTTCSTGVHVKQGYVAVNPRQIPYGTKMYIVSSDGKWVYGYAIAADTGGFATNGSGTIVDLYMNSYNDCVNFGRRTVEIYIL